MLFVQVCVPDQTGVVCTSYIKCWLVCTQTLVGGHHDIDEVEKYPAYCITACCHHAIDTPRTHRPHRRSQA